jgi:hypothetical protein
VPGRFTQAAAWRRLRRLRAEAANNYKLLATFDAGQDGVRKHAELIHANVIARRSITTDGNLADWQGTLPQASAQTVGVNASEKAYLPFQNWDRQDGGGSVTAWLAADDHYFYLAAKVPRMDGLIRYETRNDDEFFYPAKVTSEGKELTWPAGVRRFSYCTAVIGAGGAAGTIAINGTIQLAALTFNTANGSYTLADGSSGALTSPGGALSITNNDTVNDRCLLSGASIGAKLKGTMNIDLAGAGDNVALTNTANDFIGASYAKQVK